MKYIQFSCKMSVVVVVQIIAVVLVCSCCYRHPVLTKIGMGQKIKPPPPSIKHDHSFSSSVLFSAHRWMAYFEKLFYRDVNVPTIQQNINAQEDIQCDRRGSDGLKKKKYSVDFQLEMDIFLQN